MKTTINAIVVAVQNSGMRYGSVWPSPPMAVMTPDAMPRFQGDPRPEILPSSCAASVKPIEIPAPTDAERPTRKVVHGSWVAKAVAKIGAMVEIDPSISPAKPGWTQVRMNSVSYTHLRAHETG